MNNFKSYFLTEGGAAGHMAHPFDVLTVKTGKDLISFFNKAYNSLRRHSASLKIDGVNVSIKLVNTGSEETPIWQFALDRGSMKPLDVKGITIKDLKDRFGEGHGMVLAGEKTLAIMNAAIPSISRELEKLGFYTDPNLFFNTEFVQGRTNVLTYDQDFLAIHGINKFYQATPNRRASMEVSYDKNTLNTLIEKLNEVAKKHNFKVFGDVPAKLEKTPDYNSVLNQPFTVIQNGQKSEETLRKRLETATNPVKKTIKLNNGKTVSALSKEVYVYVLNGTPLEQFVANKKDFKTAIDGAAIYHATRVLGDALLKVVNSEMGEADKHEGIVIRDLSISPNPVKVTGNFILKGLESQFRKTPEESEEGEGVNLDIPEANPQRTSMPRRSVYTDPPYIPGDNGMYMTPKPYGPMENFLVKGKVTLFNELTNMVVGTHLPEHKRVIVIYPGRFQPFHKGHEAVFQKLKEQFPQAKVYIATSDRPAKFDPAKHFLNFDEKLQTIVASGADPQDVVKTVNPYTVPELVNKFAKDSTILIFAVGKKDMEGESSRFNFKPKKDGMPSYFQPYRDEVNCQTLDKHAYIMPAPTETFSVLGKNVTSATQIRDMYKKGSDAVRKQIVTDLYGKYIPIIKKLFDRKIG